MRFATGPVVVLSLPFLFALSSPLAQGYPVEGLMDEGEIVPGIGQITAFLKVVVNDTGDWLAEIDTNNIDLSKDQALLRNGTVLLREGQSLAEPPGATVVEFVRIRVDEDGNAISILKLGGMPGDQDEGIFFNDTPVLLKGQNTGAGGVTPGSPFTWFLGVEITTAGEWIVAATVDDSTIVGSFDHVLLRVAVDGAGGLLSETLVAMEDQILPGETVPIRNFGSSTQEPSIAGNAAGQNLYVAVLHGVAGSGLFLDGTRVAGEGEPSPLSNRDYLPLRGRAVHLNDLGDYSIYAQVEGLNNTNEFLQRNEDVFVRESQLLDDIAPYGLHGGSTTFGAPHRTTLVDDSGNMIWTGRWDLLPSGGVVPSNENDGIFINEQLLVRESVTEIDGVLLTALFTGNENFAVSDGGRQVLFVGDYDGTVKLARTVVSPPPPVPDGRHRNYSKLWLSSRSGIAGKNESYLQNLNG